MNRFRNPNIVCQQCTTMGAIWTFLVHCYYSHLSLSRSLSLSFHCLEWIKVYVKTGSWTKPQMESTNCSQTMWIILTWQYFTGSSSGPFSLPLPFSRTVLHFLCVCVCVTHTLAHYILTVADKRTTFSAHNSYNSFAFFCSQLPFASASMAGVPSRPALADSVHRAVSVWLHVGRGGGAVAVLPGWGGGEVY